MNPHYCHNCANTGKEWLPGSIDWTPCRYCDKPTGRLAIWTAIILAFALFGTWAYILWNL